MKTTRSEQRKNLKAIKRELINQYYIHLFSKLSTQDQIILTKLVSLIKDLSITENIPT